MEVGNGVSPGVDFPGLTIFYDISATSAIFDIGKYSANSIFFWGIAYQKELDAAKSQSVDQGGFLPPCPSISAMGPRKRLPCASTYLGIKFRRELLN